MRILFCLNGNSVGGATLSFMNLLTGIISCEHEVFVVLPYGGFLEKNLNELGVRYKIVYNRNIVRPSFKKINEIPIFVIRWLLLLVNYLATIRIAIIAKHFNADIIHSNNSIVSCGYYAAKMIGIPHVFHIREYIDKDFNIITVPSLRKLKRRFQNNYTITITKDISNHFSLLPKYNRVIYNGIFSRNVGTIKEKKERYFLFVGMFSEAKCPMELLDAFISIHDEIGDCRLKFVGNRTNNEEIVSQMIQKVKANNLSDKVEFLGVKNDVDKIMQKAISIVVPSKFEGFGRITAEAMFNGCPVIGKDTGGTKEQFDNGLYLTGKEIAFRYNTSAELSVLMKNIANQDFMNTRPMVERALFTVKRLYSCENNVESTLKFYNYVLSDYHSAKISNAQHSY